MSGQHPESVTEIVVVTTYFFNLHWLQANIFWISIHLVLKTALRGARWHHIWFVIHRLI